MDNFTHYLFVNHCLNIISEKKLPSYCYYDDNSQLDTFYDNITMGDKQTIYKYLVNNKHINPFVITETHFIANTRRLIESFCVN